MMQIGGLSLTGLGIDFFRHHVDSGAPQPRWWFGFEPPVAWNPMSLVILIAVGILLLAVTRSLLNYLSLVSTSDLIQRRLVVELRDRIPVHRIALRIGETARFAFERGTLDGGKHFI